MLEDMFWLISLRTKYSKEYMVWHDERYKGNKD